MIKTLIKTVLALSAICLSAFLASEMFNYVSTNGAGMPSLKTMIVWVLGVLVWRVALAIEQEN
jgi:hypothetical protein